MALREIETARLVLRPLAAGDAPAIAAYAGDYDVAKNLARVPHPYSEADARGFLKYLAGTGREHAYAVTDRSGGAFMGCCGVHPGEDGLYELGYWLGKPFWGRGFATEAARALAGLAFVALRLERIGAGWFEDNPASGNVLEKVGFVPAGQAPRQCLARGHAVTCKLVLLEKDGFSAAG